MALSYSSSVEDFDQLDNRIGEVKYLRASYYFLLVQHYGGITLTTDFINSPILAFERNSAEDVYKFVISELEEAKDLVADGAYNGRVTKRGCPPPVGQSLPDTVDMKVLLPMMIFQKLQVMPTRQSMDRH